LRTAYKGSVSRVVAAWWTQPHVLSFGDKRLTQSGKFMEPGAAEIMGLSFLEGDGGLEEPGSVLLSSSAAKAVFGNSGAVGKTMTIDGEMVVRVRGVYADVPRHSEFASVQFVAPLALFVSANPWAKEVQTNWGYDMVELFVQLREGVDL